VREWFESLQVRERQLVATAAVVVVLGVFYLAIWMPLDRGQENAAADVEVWRSALVELRSLKGDLQRAGTERTVPAGQGQSLLVIVDNSLRGRNLYSALQSSTPTRSNGIQLVFENVAFDELLLWVGDVVSSFGLQVSNANFSPPSRDEAGRVNANLTLER
jgi:general secretion pathway protein M